MKYLFILAFLVSGIAKAQTFDFSCAQLTNGVYQSVAGIPASDEANCEGTNLPANRFYITDNEITNLQFFAGSWTNWPGWPGWSFHSLEGNNLRITIDECIFIFTVTEVTD